MGEDNGDIADIIKDDIDNDTFEGRYDATVRKKLLLILSLGIISFIFLCLGMCLGAVDIPFIDLVRVFLHPIFGDLIEEPSQSYY